jgi:hypothetical protein
MVEAHSHLKQLPTSIIDMYKIFEHIDMLSICLQYQPYTVIPTLLFASDFGVLVNSLTAIDGHDRQYFNKLCSTVVSRQIFIRLQSLIAR